MNQLVAPNLSVVGHIDLCLAYAEAVFGAPNIEPFAWEAWGACQFKHTDNIPTDVSVPVWFSWTGTVDGITKNWGHVAVSTPQGVYTSPLQETGHTVYPSVGALEKAYGVKYVGWSEDISTLRIIEGEDMAPASQRVTDDQVVIAAFEVGANFHPDEQFIKDRIGAGQTVLETIREAGNSIEHHNIMAAAALAPALQKRIDGLTLVPTPVSAPVPVDPGPAPVVDPPTNVTPPDPNSVVVTKDSLWARFTKWWKS